jgi:hypothetical protein
VKLSPSPSPSSASGKGKREGPNASVVTRLEDVFQWGEERGFDTKYRDKVKRLLMDESLNATQTITLLDNAEEMGKADPDEFPLFVSLVRYVITDKTGATYEGGAGAWPRGCRTSTGASDHERRYRHPRSPGEEPADRREAPSQRTHRRSPSGGGAARGQGQGLATMINLIFAGQRSRCRMILIGCGSFGGTQPGAVERPEDRGLELSETLVAFG